MSIRTDEHVFISGITGGGKTHLAKSFLSQMPRVIKLDTKQEALDDIAKKINPWKQVDPKKLAIVTRLKDVMYVDHPYIIYCPDVDELTQESFDEFFRWVYYDRKGSHTVTWVDELMEISEGVRIPRHLKYLYTKGRSRNTPVWGLTQRPVTVSPLCLSQSTHIFSFDLPLPQDRKKLAETTGAPEMLERPDGYQFWYFKRGWRSAVKGVMEA